jgi:hypothetical protein
VVCPLKREQKKRIKNLQVTTRAYKFTHQTEYFLLDVGFDAQVKE